MRSPEKVLRESPREKYDRAKGSPEGWMLRDSAAQPGPFAYEPKLKSRNGNKTGLQPNGTTFGLKPELLSSWRADKGPVPDAHDMLRSVDAHSHLVRQHIARGRRRRSRW